MPRRSYKPLPPRRGGRLNRAHPEVAAPFPSATSGYPLPTLRVDWASEREGATG